jgi:hypothetical protein
MWCREETLLFSKLLAKYGDELHITKRNRRVWEKIASVMQKNGYERTFEQCRNRRKVLLRKGKVSVGLDR